MHTKICTKCISDLEGKIKDMDSGNKSASDGLNSEIERLKKEVGDEKDKNQKLSQLEKSLNETITIRDSRVKELEDELKRLKDENEAKKRHDEEELLKA